MVSDQFDILNINLEEFLTSNPQGTVNFIHRTMNEKTALKIMQEGFLFSGSFHKTTDEVINNPNYLRFWLRARHHYGKFIILICISKQMIDKYINLLKPFSKEVEEVYHVFTETESQIDPDEEVEVYKMSSMFIKGFFNTDTQEIFLNKGFDPFYESPVFMKNIKRLKKKR